MAVIGTFGSFTAARLGIYASQASLNVTCNNISNINTKGYTRQRMDLVSLHSAGSARYANSYNLDIGYGVIADSVSQLRDPFLDIRYRDEQSKLGEAETRLDGLNQLAHILDEVGKGDGEFGIVEAQFNDCLAQLEVLQSEAVALRSKMESQSSTQNVENYASATLGMGKADKYQITYMNLGGEGSIYRTDKAPDKAPSQMLLRGFDNLMEYMKLR